MWIDQWFAAVPLSHTVPRSKKVWRRDSEKLKSWAVAPNPKFKAPGVRLLAGFSATGPRPAKLLFATRYKKLNQDSALELYTRVIIPALRRRFPGRGKFLVQQDGDRSLNAFSVVDRLKELGVTIAFRGGRTGPQAPARFCDFWPCETMWANRKIAVRKMIEKSKKWSKGVGTTCDAKTLKAWGAAVMGVVRRVPSSFLQRMHAGMFKRRLQLLKAKGGPIPK